MTTKDLYNLLGPAAAIVARQAGYSTGYWERAKSDDIGIKPERARNLEKAIKERRQVLNQALRELGKIK